MTLLLMFFLVPAAISAQELKWDAALGQYQRICDECISLRIRSASGERINASEVTALLSRLTSLKEILQGATGQMTPAQRLRFQAIRLRYEEVFGLPVRSTISLPKLSSHLSAPAAALKVQEFCAPCNTGHKPSGVRASVILFAGVPDLYYGAMVSLSRWRFGGYIKASAGIPFIKPAYSCFADGTTPAGYIWTSGKESISRWAVTAGATFAPLNFLSIYAGAGYGRRSFLWQDVAGKWAEVTDRSAAGLALDGGAVFQIGRASILAGVSFIGGGTVCAEFGLGLNF